MPAKFEPSLVGKVPVRFGHGVVVHAKIKRQLPYGRQPVSRLKTARDEQRSQPGEYLFVRRHGRIVIDTECGNGRHCLCTMYNLPQHFLARQANPEPITKRFSPPENAPLLAATLPRWKVVSRSEYWYK